MKILYDVMNFKIMIELFESPSHATFLKILIDIFSLEYRTINEAENLGIIWWRIMFNFSIVEKI